MEHEATQALTARQIIAEILPADRKAPDPSKFQEVVAAAMGSPDDNPMGVDVPEKLLALAFPGEPVEQFRQVEEFAREHYHPAAHLVRHGKGIRVSYEPIFHRDLPRPESIPQSSCPACGQPLPISSL